MAVVSWTGWVLTICLLAAFFLWCWLFTPTPPEEQVQSAPAGQPDSLRKGADPVLREAVICGPNVLYMLLALNGIPVDHDLIEKYMPSHAEGMSLAELKEASNALGLRTETRRCSIDELRRHFQVPVIAHLKIGQQRHYVIVIGMTAETVSMLDGTTGERWTVDSEWLQGAWSGYVLMPHTGVSMPWPFLAVCLFGWMLLGLFALKRYKPRNAKP